MLNGSSGNFCLDVTQDEASDHRARAWSANVGHYIRINGGNGPPVQVRVALRAGSHPLLQVGVSARGVEQFFLVDPQGGSLTVLDEGGSGGSGGRGGSGSPSGMSGRDGLSGHDGSSGWSGKGGSITVTYDPQAKPLLGIIKLSNQGGPAPVFKEEAVGPLW